MTATIARNQAPSAVRPRRVRMEPPSSAWGGTPPGNHTTLALRGIVPAAARWPREPVEARSLPAEGPGRVRPHYDAPNMEPQPSVPYRRLGAASEVDARSPILMRS